MKDTHAAPFGRSLEALKNFSQEEAHQVVCVHEGCHGHGRGWTYASRSRMISYNQTFHRFRLSAFLCHYMFPTCPCARGHACQVAFIGLLGT